MTPKEWAQKRNLNKGYLVRIRTILGVLEHDSILNFVEQSKVNSAKAAIKEILFNWDQRNHVSRRRNTKP